MKVTKGKGEVYSTILEKAITICCAQTYEVRRIVPMAIIFSTAYQ